jgi:hypothetical protein
MILRGCTNQRRLFVRCKGQENQRRPRIRQWIASLADGACHFIVPGPSPLSATKLKHRLNTKHPTAERSRSDMIARYVQMRLTIEVFIA